MLTNQNKENSEHKNVVAIVGGGNIGRDLLQIFLKMDSIKVKYVLDINSKAPAIKLARENNIKTTSEIETILSDTGINLIIEVTGVDKVVTAIKNNKREETDLITGEAAYLVYNLIEDYKKFQQQLLFEVIEHLNHVHSEIEQDSRNINSLLAEINNVTGKLNMLAINASIEAAHAGSEGRGFSVVADEVKNLSEKSTQLVRNIDEINEDVIGLNNRIFEIISGLKEDKSEVTE